MTTETVLTDEQIQWIGSGARLSEYGGALAFARAIERAVLQSPEMQQRMEAYDTARVQEMLHEEAKPDNIKRAEYYGEGYGDGWKAALESLAAIAKKNYLAALAGRVDVDEDDDDDRNMEIFNVGQVAQALAYSKMEGAIRALLPSTLARPESEQ